MKLRILLSCCLLTGCIPANYGMKSIPPKVGIPYTYTTNPPTPVMMPVGTDEQTGGYDVRPMYRIVAPEKPEPIFIPFSGTNGTGPGYDQQR